MGPGVVPPDTIPYRFGGYGKKRSSFMSCIKPNGKKTLRNLDEQDKWVKDARGNSIHLKTVSEYVVNLPQGMVNILLIYQRFAVMAEYHGGHEPVPKTCFTGFKHIYD